MSGLYAAELLKLRTVRSTWGYVVTVIGLAGLVAAATIGSESELGRLAPDFQAQIVYDATGAPTILALLLGITLFTNEFRHGTITPTLLVTPRRERLVAAKLLAGATTGAALVVVAVVVVAVVATIWLGILGVGLEPGEAAHAAGRALLAAVVAGALGAAVGGLVHAQVAALVGALVWLFVAEPLAGGLAGLLDVDSVADYLPGTVVFAINDPNSEGLSFWPALAVGVVFVAGAAALAVLRTSRRDIT
jgi:ABC-type transport system involved in multi-copper enzyme maturation permease subunit